MVDATRAKRIVFSAALEAEEALVTAGDLPYSSQSLDFL